MSTKFFTNQEGNSLLQKFEGVFENVPTIRYFDALVGYFRASGYFKIRPFLDRIPKIRILVGINVDQITKRYQQQGLRFLATDSETKEQFLKEMIQNVQEAEYDAETEEGILQFIEDIISKKIEIRAHQKRNIHAKVYIFRPESFNEHAPCEVITGSSNLTNSGLGASPESNYEFNVSLRDYEDVKFATDEFEELWKESVPILEAEVSKLKKKTYLNEEFTPFELYIKMLIEYFGQRVEYDPYNIELLLPDKFMRLKYQADAANHGYAIMNKHNGFILADVVGLGKTVVACMVIKKFIYETGPHTKILVVVPPALEENWVRTAEDFQIKNHFEFITTGSLHKVTDRQNYHYSNSDKFDMVVVDESHRFRNDYTQMYLELQNICKTPRSTPGRDGDTRKKVILLSATPLNNTPEDIENQLYLFQDKRSSTIENVRNLQDYFKTINDTYKKLAEEPELNLDKLKRLFEKLRNDVVEPLVIRRTREDLKNDKNYLKDLEEQGLIFPEVQDPIALYYEMDEKLSRLFHDTVGLITGVDEHGEEVEGLDYYRYRAIEFLSKEEVRKQYGNVGQISGRLSAIMRTLLVKRLESSFYAFRQSLSRLDRAIDNMLEMFERDRIFIAPDLDINKLLEEGYSYDQIEEKINERAGNNRAFTADDFEPEFVEHLRQDKAKIEALVKRWDEIDYDPKLDEFMDQINGDFLDAEKNPSGKLVIFTESKETANLLEARLKEEGEFRLLTNSAENRKQLEQTIKENFDANVEEADQKDDFDIVVTTEVLAEGINLHRSNTVINYDVPWNSTRLMQRIGRVNRIGSIAEQIYVYNFYPSAKGDQQIRLVDTALRKLQAFHTAFGEDNKVFSLLEEPGDGGLFGNKIKKEESEILKYLNELREFKEKHAKYYERIKKIPNKARCGRRAVEHQVDLFDDSLDNISLGLQHTSLSYLKSDNHPGIFCLVTPEGNPVELNFLQAVKLYKADPDEERIDVHDTHHQQVQTGFAYFKTNKAQKRMNQATAQNLSPTENRAIGYLDLLPDLVEDEQRRKSIIQCIKVIKQGRFASRDLPKAINDYFKRNERLLTTQTQKVVEGLFEEILNNYDLTLEEDTTKEISESEGMINPKIVLTQSFS